MSNRVCHLFTNCLNITKFVDKEGNKIYNGFFDGLSIEGMSSLIRDYNDFAKKVNTQIAMKQGKPVTSVQGFPIISDTFNYDIKQLEQLAAYIKKADDMMREAQKRQKEKPILSASELEEKAIQEKRRKEASERGGYIAAAFANLDNSTLTGTEISSLVSEIVHVFIDSAIKYADTEGITLNELFRRPEYSPDKILGMIYTNKYRQALATIDYDRKAAEARGDKEGIKIANDKKNLLSKFVYFNNLEGSQDHFRDLVTLAIPIINKITGVKLNLDMSFNADDSSVLYSEIENIEDMEEPVHERWMQLLDKTNLNLTLSESVNRLLMLLPKEKHNKIPYWTRGNTVYNSEEELPRNEKGEIDTRNLSLHYRIETEIEATPIFGMPMLSNVGREARRLARILEGVNNISEMMGKLDSIPRYSTLVTELKNNPDLQRTFFQAFDRYAQPAMAIEIAAAKDGTVVTTARNLNRPGLSLLNSWISKIEMGDINEFSMFVSQAKAGSKKMNVRVRWRTYVDAYNEFNTYFNPETNTVRRKEITTNGKTVISTPWDTLNPSRKASVVAMILDCLNIDTTIDRINDVLNTPSELAAFITNAGKLFSEEISDKNMFFPTVTSKLTNTKSTKNILSTIDESGTTKEAIIGLLKIFGHAELSQFNVGVSSHMGNSVSYRVMPSPMSIFIKKMRSLNGDDLRRYLENKFLSSPQYAKRDKNGNLIIYNRWLRDFYENPSSTSLSAAPKDVFELSRTIDYQGIPLEKASPKIQAFTFLFTYMKNRNYSPKWQLVDSLDERQSKSGKKYVLAGTSKWYEADSDVGVFRDDYAILPTFITGDTNAVRSFRTIHYYESEIIDEMLNLYYADKANQKVIGKLQEDGIVVNANGKESLTQRGRESSYGILQFLNEPKWRKRLEEIETEESVPEDSFKKLVEDYMNESFDEFMKYMRNLGVFEKIMVNKTVVGSDNKNYIKQIAVYKYFDSELKSAIDYTKEDPYEDRDKELEAKMREFFFDYKYAQYAQANIEHVTPFSFIDAKDMQKRNKATLTNGYRITSDAVDMNGNPLWDENDFTQRAVYFVDISTSMDSATKEALRKQALEAYKESGITEELAEALADEFVAQYEKNTLTDGQGYRSLDSYRRILHSLGENFWTRQHEEAYNRIQEIRNKVRKHRDANGNIVEGQELTIEDIQEIEDLMVVFQPIKPINDTMETWGDTNMKIGVQFKYAEVPIIPEMYPKESKLRQMGEWMEDNGIDLLCSNKCLKKGSFGEIDLQYRTSNGMYVDKNGIPIKGLDSNGNEVIAGVSKRNPTMAEQRRYISKHSKTLGDPRVAYGDDVTFSEIMENQTVSFDGKVTSYVIHKIPMDNFLIQTNVPDHTNNDSIVGTQPRKIIDGAIINDDSTLYNVGGKKVKGSKLHKLYNSLHTTKYFKSFVKFMNLVGDPKRLTANLAQSLLNNGRSNLSMIGRIALDENGLPRVPYVELGNGRDISDNMVSIFKRFVIRQMIAGGSLVQASAMGAGKTALADPDLHATFDENRNLVGAEAEMPFDFTVTDESGHRVALQYDDWCNADGTFKTDAKGNTLIEKRYPGILDIVAYRIPTEMEYSIFKIHIKRVTPKGAANTIKLPVEYSTIAGFDFDIDKLFLMRYVFRIKSGEYDNESASAIWERIYNLNGDNPDAWYVKAGIYENLKKAKERYNLEVPEAKEALSELMAKKGVTKVSDLKLHDYWDLANIKYSKAELFEAVANELNIELGKSGLSLTRNAELQKSAFDFSEDVNPSELMDLPQSDIDNALVDCYLAVLSHPSTIIDRYSHGGFATESDDARAIRVLQNMSEDEYNSMGKASGVRERVAKDKNLDYEPSYDYSDPSTELFFKQLNQAAEDLIGIFANGNVNSFISKFLSTFKISSTKKAIRFGNLLNVTEINGVNKVEGTFLKNSNDIGRSFLFTSVNGIKPKKVLAELLAAAVDAVKDPVLNYLNLNPITADAAIMLAKLGYSTYDIGLLFNQPIVKQTCEYMNENGISSFTTALLDVLKKNGNVGVTKKNLLENWNEAHLTQDALALNIVKYNSDSAIPASTGAVMSVAKLMNYIMTVKGEFSGYIQDTRSTSANTVKSRFADYIAKSEKEDAVEKNSTDSYIEIVAMKDDEGNVTMTYPIEKDLWRDWEADSIEENLKEFLKTHEGTPFEYENAVHNLIDFAMSYMIDNYTPYSSDYYTKARQILMQLMSPYGLSGDIVDKLHTHLLMYRLKNLNGDFNPFVVPEDNDILAEVRDEHGNPVIDENGEPVLKPIEYTSNADYYLGGTIDVLLNFMDMYSPEVWDYITKENEFTRNIKWTKLNYNDINSPAVLDFKYSYDANAEEKLGITLGWNELMELGGDFAKLGKMIYMHFYYLRGLNPAYNKLVELAPPSVLESLVADDAPSGTTSYLEMYDKEEVDLIQEDSGALTEEINDSVFKFMCLNANDTSIVPLMPFHLSDVKVEREGMTEDIVAISGIGLNYIKLNKTRKGFYVKPIINIDGAIYALAKPTETGLTAFGTADAAASVRYSNYMPKGVNAVQYIRLDISTMKVGTPENEEEGSIGVPKDVSTVIDVFGKYFTKYNGFIFGNYSALTAVPSYLNTETITADESDDLNNAPSERTPKQAADDAENETKNEEIVGSDGKETC